MKQRMKEENGKEKKIVELEPEVAQTVFWENSLEPEKEMDEAGIINLVSQSVWKFFEDNRQTLANELGIDELDLVLADARILGAESNKKQIFRIEELLGSKNPFKIKTYLTVADRDHLPEEAVTILEPGAVRAHLAGKSQKKPVLFLESGNDATYFYFASPDGTKRLSSWPWGLNSVLREMGKELATDAEVNREIYLRYINNEVSEEARRTIERSFTSSLEEFQRGLAANLHNYKEALNEYKRLPAFYRASFQLPEWVYEKRFAADGRRILLKKPEEADISLLFADENVAAREEFSEKTLQRIKWLMA